MSFAFYDIVHDGVAMRLPRVTTLLGVIDKSNPLMWWATGIEQRAYRASLEDALTTPGLTPDEIWSRVTAGLQGKRAWVKERDKAANIGTQAHDWIKWHTRGALGFDPGAEPALSEGALRSVSAWLDWTAAVDYVPLYAERRVYCPRCAVAGTLDAIGKVAGKVVLLDVKTGKAVYNEAHMQINFYRHMAAREGIRTDNMMVVRLPKTPEEPDFDVVPVRAIPLSALRAVATTWRLVRWMNGDDTGSARMTPCQEYE